MSEKKESSYKDTLNLPQTAFDMKANLLTKEPAVQARWKQEDLYGQIRRAGDGKARFVLHDGPPYANGNIHMGTALNKVLKDMVVRVKNMTGFDSPYVPGWDCHGLPIEAKVMDELRAAAGKLSPTDIRRRCAAYADKFVQLQSQQFQRLGVMGEFDKPYITMSPQYESAVLGVFADLVEQGLVFRQRKPVHWSIENRTALAEAELEYYDRQDASIYVALALTPQTASQLPGQADAPKSLLIWTTTPWTLPANRAVALHPDFTYCAVHADTADGPMTLVLAEERIATVLGAVAKSRPEWLKGHKTIAKMTGKELLDRKLQYRHPLAEDRACPVVAASYVTLEDGTGLVHTAPGHGLEDYSTGLKNGLEIYCPVLDDGTFDDTAPQWLHGLSVWKGNEKVVEHLTGRRTLVLKETVTHSYPHDWRSKTPTIFRATEQWFIAVDRPLCGGKGPTLRKLAMDTIGQAPPPAAVEAARHLTRQEAPTDIGGVEFIPGWGRNRIGGMLQSRPDWCISRQRAWGLPIPAFFNDKNQPLLTPASVRAVAAAFAKHGSDAWYTLSPKQLLEGYDPAKDEALDQPADFAIEKLRTGGDIFDVWFESGSSWAAVAVARGLVSDIPVDLYLEGSDQHRGWFQLSLLPALGSRGLPPFKTVLTHGWVLDENGRKMSKSLGNTIDVIEQLNKRGADILRLWTASQYYPDDVRCSEGMIAQSEDAYRKIRNTLRYCMGACFDFDPAKNAAEPTDHSIDHWMRMQLHILIRDVRAAYDGYEFHKASRLLYEFCTVQASSVYMSAVKDRLYCESPDAIRRRATQTVLYEMLMALVKLLAPIIPHTADEAWQHIPHRPAGEPASVHLASLPDYDAAVLRLAEDLRPESRDLAAFAADQLQVGPGWIWDRLMDLRADALVKLENLKNAGVKNALDAEVVLQVPRSDAAAGQLLDNYHKELEDLLGVGYAHVERVDKLPEGVTVAVEVLDSRQKYQRCARSWKRRPDVGSDKDYPDLSARDAAVVREIKK